MGPAKLIIIIFSVLLFIVVLFSAMYFYNPSSSRSQMSFNLNKVDCTKFSNITQEVPEQNDCGYVISDDSDRIHRFLVKVEDIENDKMDVSLNLGGVKVVQTVKIPEKFDQIALVKVRDADFLIDPVYWDTYEVTSFTEDQHIKEGDIIVLVLDTLTDDDISGIEKYYSDKEVECFPYKSETIDILRSNKIQDIARWYLLKRSEGKGCYMTTGQIYF